MGLLFPKLSLAIALFVDAFHYQQAKLTSLQCGPQRHLGSCSPDHSQPGIGYIPPTNGRLLSQQYRAYNM